MARKILHALRLAIVLAAILHGLVRMVAGEAILPSGTGAIERKEVGF